ncbi:hypothetical protein ACIQUX_12045 [Streptomyces sp. NPDC101133]|uniref:hypothetical protein n=1 Tax=Streptomyces sp. NPDC101133 TaxID=3366111 RepID=UPI0037F31797
MSKKRPGGESLSSAPSTATGSSPDHEVPAATPAPDPKRWWALAVIALAQLMVILDGTVVNIALPSAQRALGMLGLGMGLTFMPVYATATAGVPAQDAGVASAVLNTVQQMGASLGTVLLNTIATSATGRYLHSHVRGPDADGATLDQGMVHGFSVAYRCSAGVLLLAALVAGLTVWHRTPKHAGHDAPA